MARYFAYNTLAGCKRNNANIVDGVTTAGHFDSAFVSSCIQLPMDAAAFMQVDNFGAATTLWSRFDLRMASQAGSAAIILLQNGSTDAYRLFSNTNADQRLQFWNGSAWVQVGPTFALSVNTRLTLVLRVVCGVSMEVFSGGTSLASGTFTGGQSQVTACRFMGHPGGINSLSQIMGADYDLRDANYMHQPPNANGFYTQGTGTAADVAEAVLDDATALSLSTSGHKRTFTKPAITVPSGKVIAGAVVNARGRIGGSITNARALVRSGATDAISSNLNYGLGFEPRSAIFEQDPSTLAAFTQAGFNAAEFGVEAV